jgi:hypothetical protein
MPHWVREHDPALSKVTLFKPFRANHTTCIRTGCELDVNRNTLISHNVLIEWF